MTKKRIFFIVISMTLVIGFFLSGCSTTPKSKSTGSKPLYNDGYGYYIINDGKEVNICSYNTKPLPPDEISKLTFGNTKWAFLAGNLFTLQLHENGTVYVNTRGNDNGTWEFKDNKVTVKMDSPDGESLLSVLDVINASTITGRYYYAKERAYDAFFVKIPQSERNIAIPEKINGIPVKSIGKPVSSIYGTYIRDAELGFWHQNISSVILPDTIIAIADSSFYNNNIASIVIPNSVIYLSGFNVNKITEISIPPSVKIIGGLAFAGNKITTLTIPETVTEVKEYAFNVNPLTLVSVPIALFNNDRIGPNAFGNSKSTKIIFSTGEYTNAEHLNKLMITKKELESLIKEEEDDAQFLRRPEPQRRDVSFQAARLGNRVYREEEQRYQAENKAYIAELDRRIKRSEGREEKIVALLLEYEKLAAEISDPE